MTNETCLGMLANVRFGIYIHLGLFRKHVLHPKIHKMRNTTRTFCLQQHCMNPKNRYPTKKTIHIFNVIFRFFFPRSRFGKDVASFKSHVFFICFRKCRLNKRISWKKSPANPVGETPLHNSTDQGLGWELSPFPMASPSRPGKTRTKTGGGEGIQVGIHPPSLTLSSLDSPSGIVVLFFFAKKNWRNSKFRMLQLLRQLSASLSLKGFCFLDVWLQKGQSPCRAQVQADRMQNLVPFFLERQGGVYIYYIYIYYIYIYIYMPLKILAGFHVRNGGGWFRSFSEIFSWDPWL